MKKSLGFRIPLSATSPMLLALHHCRQILLVPPMAFLAPPSWKVRFC